MADERGVTGADTLIVPGELWTEVLRHLEDALPNEGVGLVGVETSADASTRVATARAFHPGRNTRMSPSRFDLDVRDLVAGLRAIEGKGLSLGAIVHSHPKGKPAPSRTDLAEAYYPEALMVIVSFAGLAPVAKAWKLVGDETGRIPVEVPIVIAGAVV